MIKTALTFLLIYFSLQIASDLNKDNLRDLKPSPKKIPVTFDAHGVKRVDNYYWMRDDTRKDQEVIDHLNTENAYLEGWFASGLDERDKLFQEITDRIPKKEDSVPIRLKNYENTLKKNTNMKFISFDFSQLTEEDKIIKKVNFFLKKLINKTL